MNAFERGESSVPLEEHHPHPPQHGDLIDTAPVPHVVSQDEPAPTISVGSSPTTPIVTGAIAGALPGYEILGVLGRGGMGVVYKARQVKLNRLVALKMILAGEHAGAQAIARFLAEARAVAKLSHPNIVQVFEIGEHEGLPFIAMEFVAGGALTDHWKKAPAAHDVASGRAPV